MKTNGPATFSTSASLDLDENDLTYFCSLIERRAGIHLTVTKRELVRTRLRSRVVALGLTDYAEYRRYLTGLPRDHAEWETFVNALTTNKTDFFREPRHFDYLIKDILPVWVASSHPTFNAWSAASSTGEEAYTLAMVLHRHLPPDRSFRILATDIDTDVLARAKNAVYSTAKRPEIPTEYHAPCLDFGTGGADGFFRIKPALRDRVVFKAHNLIDKTVPGTDVFDLILCRNVLIYFTPETIDFVQAKLLTATRPGGTLFIGHSESLQGLAHRWQPKGPAVFAKPNSHVVETAAPSGAAVTPTRRRRVLIVDDSKTIRDLLQRVLAEDPELEVVGVAVDALEAERMLETVKPDVITLDINMPNLSGVDWLERLLPRHPIPVVMISSLQMQEGNEVFRSLELGAVDYVQKPTLAELPEVGPLIREKVRAAAGARVILPHARRERSTLVAGSVDPRAVVVIGASTGGTEALKDVLSAMPDRIPPTLIVQHIPPVFSKTFAERLDTLCAFDVKEAEDGDELRENRVLIAPGGRQMKVEKFDRGYRVRITDDAPVNRHRPSVDYLFDSVAAVVKHRGVAVILTGMGGDGARGLLRLRQVGWRTIGQDEDSCVVYGMPKVAFELGAVEKVVPLSQIAGEIFTPLVSRPPT